MKSRFFIILFVALAIGGCSNGSPSMPAVQPGQQRASGATPAALGEVLSFKLTVTKKLPCVKHQAGGAAFKLSGTASGPYKGKLTGVGQWSFTHVGTTLWTLSETFKIVGAKSGNGTITGNGTGTVATCTTFAASSKGITYHLGTSSGSAATTLLKNAAHVVQHLK